MVVETKTLNISNLGFATEVDVSYICPHCRRRVSDRVGLSNEGLGDSVVLCDCECPNCGDYVDLDIYL